jgi:hypothetical protein
MGGKGSGRHCRFDNRLYTEDFRSIDIKEFNQRGWLDITGLTTLTWSRNGEKTATVQFLVWTGVQFPSKPNITLRYKSRSNGADWRSMDYPIELQATNCNYGGIRYWFTCPECSKRVCVLYNGDIFKCRTCLGLVHKSRNESALDQAIRSIYKEKDKLWPDMELCFYDSVQWQDKPKWMRQHTFITKKIKLLPLENKVTSLITNGFRANVFNIN